MGPYWKYVVWYNIDRDSLKGWMGELFLKYSMKPDIHSQEIASTRRHYTWRYHIYLSFSLVKTSFIIWKCYYDGNLDADFFLNNGCAYNFEGTIRIMNSLHTCFSPIISPNRSRAAATHGDALRVVIRKSPPQYIIAFACLIRFVEYIRRCLDIK